MTTNSTLAELVGKDLTGFKIVEMTEVYSTNESGMKSQTLGFFKDSKVAEAFIGIQKDAAYHGTSKVLVLTDGVIGYVIQDQEAVTLFDDAAETAKIRKHVLDKLSPAERHILGIVD